MELCGCKAAVWLLATWLLQGPVSAQVSPGPSNVTDVNTTTISLTSGATPNMADANYKPVQIPVSNITVDNQGTTNSLKVTWNSPPGNVDNYTVHIKDDQEDPAYYRNSTVSHTNTSHTFDNLRPGHSYNITVATNSGLHSNVSDPVSGVTIPTRPGSINVIQVNTSTISLTWGAPANMTDGTYSFRVTYTSHASNTVNFSTTNNYTTIGNLIPGTEYTIFVATIGAASILSTNMSVTAHTKPVQIPVSNITVDNQGTTNSLKVTWHSPPGNVDNYTVRIKDDHEDPVYNRNFNVSDTTTSHTINDLRPGRSYNITVATNSGPHSIISNPASGVTIPTRPGSINVIQVNTRNISLTLGAPANMTDGTYSFRVTYTSHASNTVNFNTTNNYTTIGNLVPGTEYTIFVATIGAASILSTNVSVTAHTKPVQIPVSNITVDNQGTTNSLKVTWHSPPGNVDNYTVRIKDDQEDPVYNRNFIVSDTTTSHTINDLRPGRSYNITVATNSGPHSIISNPASGVTIPTRPGSINVIQVNTRNISLTLGAPANMTDGTYSFRVTYTSHASNSVNFNTTNNYTTIGNLVPGTEYTIFVATIGAASILSTNVSVTAHTKPVQIPVSNITVENQGTTNSLKVTWHNPPGNVDNYTVRIKDDQEDPVYNRNFNVSDTTTSHTFNDLRPGRSYNITVATNSGPHSIISNPASGVTIPTRPGSINVIQVNTRNISLTLGAPANMTDGTYSFRVTYTSHASNTVNFNTTNNYTTIGNLVPGTEYTIFVATIGAASILSTNVSVTAHTKPVQIPVSNITVDNQGTTNSLKVTWHSPPGNVDNYTVRIKDDQEDPVYNRNFIVSDTTTSHTINDLRPGRSYNITVATNSGPHSIISNPASGVTIPTHPGSINVIQVNTRNISLTLGAPANMTDGTYSFRVTYTSHASNSVNFSTTNNYTTIGNLIPGTEYTIFVATIGAASILSTNVSVTAHTKPVQIPVSNITVDNQGTTNSLKVTWHSPPGNVDNYTVRIKDDQEDPVYNRNFIVSDTTTSHTINDLRPGRSYNITVATNSGPHSIISNPASGVTIPTHPGSINVIQVNTRNISLTLGAPANMTDGTYSFRVTYTSHASNSVNFSTTNNYTTIGNLIPGTEYTIFVATIGAASILSTNVSVTAHTKPVQIPVSNITVDNQGTTNSLKVTWHSPPGNVDNYTVHINDQKDPVYNRNFIVSDTTTSHTINDLRPGRSYNITVATNSGPHSIISNPASGVTIPTRPGSINVIQVNTSTISLTWGAPANMTDGTYSFRVTYTSHASNTVNFNTTNNYTTIGNLIPGTEYTIFVATIGAASILSTNVSVTAHTKPVQIPVSNITVDNQGTTNSLKVTWHSPPGNVDNYTVRIKDDQEDPVYNRNFNVSDTTTSHIINYLRPGRSYNITVATNSGPHSIISNPASGVTIPTRPGSINVIQVNTSTISLTWGAPANMTDGTYSFRVTYTSHASNSVNFSTTNNYTTIGNLVPGTEYTIFVATIGAASILSTNVSVTAHTKPVQIPVSNITVDNQGTTNSLKVTWHSPPGNVDNYTVHINDQKDPASFSNSTVLHTNTSHNFDSLRSGRRYTITVATNSGPHSIISNPVSGVTKPNSVRNVQAMAVSSTSVRLWWELPLDANPMFTYRVQTQEYSQNVTGLDVTVAQLTPGHNVTFSVFSQIESTEGSPVTVATCTDAASVENFNCKPVDKQKKLELTWNCPKGEFSSFAVQASPLNPTTVPSVNNNSAVCPVNSPGYLIDLQYGIQYNLTIVSISCGRDSQPISKVCHTSVTDPPQPPKQLPVTGLTVTHNTLTFTFSEDSFDSINGQIIAFAVVVGTEDDSGSEPKASNVGKEYSDGAAAYTTYLNILTQTARATNTSTSFTVTVGNGDNMLGYRNGKLNPLSEYRLSLVGFTRLKLTNTSRINTTESLYTSFLYSRPIETLQDPSVIAGAVVGTLLGVAVVSLLVFALFRWRRRQKQEVKNGDLVPINDIREPRKAIRVDQFENYYNKQHADSDCGFAEEFEDLKPLGTKQSTHAAQEPNNKAKNRYNNVLPYDVSRVKLSVSGDPASDYINANFVPGYKRQREYIAAQGPLPGTVADFWRMVWEMRVPAIVMLTKCVEQGRTKCEQYWPTDQPLKVDNVTVSLTSEILLTDWTIRDFKLEKAISKERRTIRHFHFMAWPDHNVPSTSQLLLEFRDLVRQHLDQHPGGPAVVHCSAGVGRTGTFICVDRLVYQIDNHDKVDIFETVCDLRMHRTLMVQTESQYIFLNRCAKDYIESRRGQGTNSIYENTPDLIYQNYSARQTHGTANGCAT